MAASVQEWLSVSAGLMPRFNATKRIDLRVHFPDRPHLAIESVTEYSKDPRQGLWQRCGFCQNAHRRVVNGPPAGSLGLFEV